MIELKELEEVGVVDGTNIRVGERVKIKYMSAQSQNVVHRKGVVKKVDIWRGDTRSFVLEADNGTDYYCSLYTVESTGTNSRRLSDGDVTMYKLSEISVEETCQTERVDGLELEYEISREFDCPKCRSPSKFTYIRKIKEEVVEWYCEHCHNQKHADHLPADIHLKIQR